MSIAGRFRERLERLARRRFFFFGMGVMPKVRQDSAYILFCGRSQDDRLLNRAFPTETTAFGNVNIVFDCQARPESCARI